MDKSDRPTGLGFFGAVIASISHEIKNRMAIINEQTLLIGDLAQASVTGRELDPGQLVELADSVKTEIHSADQIIKNMNRFAHSVDNFERQVDLGEVIDLTAVLYNRLAGMRRTQLEVHLPPKPLVVNTVAFFLMNLVWLCLDTALERIGKNRTIHLGCEEAADGAIVWLKADLIENDMADAISQKDMVDLMSGIGADAVFIPERNQVRIFLPADTDLP